MAVKLTIPSGYRLIGVFSDEDRQSKLQTDENGNYYLIVPKGGGVLVNMWLEKDVDNNPSEYDWSSLIGVRTLNNSEKGLDFDFSVQQLSESQTSQSQITDVKPTISVAGTSLQFAFPDGSDRFTLSIADIQQYILAGAQNIVITTAAGDVLIPVSDLLLYLKAGLTLSFILKDGVIEVTGNGTQINTYSIQSVAGINNVESGDTDIPRGALMPRTWDDPSNETEHGFKVSESSTGTTTQKYGLKSQSGDGSREANAAISYAEHGVNVDEAGNITASIESQKAAAVASIDALSAVGGFANADINNKANAALAIANNSAKKSIEKLAYGQRINSASDDGTAISEKMRKQIGSLDRNNNVSDESNTLETKDPLVAEILEMMNKSRKIDESQSGDGSLFEASMQSSLQTSAEQSAQQEAVNLQQTAPEVAAETDNTKSVSLTDFGTSYLDLYFNNKNSDEFWKQAIKTSQEEEAKRAAEQAAVEAQKTAEQARQEADLKQQEAEQKKQEAEQQTQKTAESEPHKTMVVKNNMSAINPLNTLNKNTSALSKSLQKVSSGRKINSSGDDAGGFAITERMKEVIRSLDQTQYASGGQSGDGSLIEETGPTFQALALQSEYGSLFEKTGHLESENYFSVSTENEKTSQSDSSEYLKVNKTLNTEDAQKQVLQESQSEDDSSADQNRQMSNETQDATVETQNVTAGTPDVTV